MHNGDIGLTVWCGHLDNKAIRRAIFLSVADLQTAILPATQKVGAEAEL
jgi:hypothetical protein